MSDNKNTDMRRLAIILQLTDEGYCKVKGCADNTDVGQLSIMQQLNGTTAHFTTIVLTGRTKHLQQSNGTPRYYNNESTKNNCHAMINRDVKAYTTINLMRTRDNRGGGVVCQGYTTTCHRQNRRWLREEEAK